MNDFNKFQTLSLFLLRISIGWVFLYSGLTKIFDSQWSAAGYLLGAETFAGFYGWLASPALLPAINLLNKWGLLFLGLSLILGVFVRLSSIFGAILMLLYYFPVLDFPYPNQHSFLVDEHIVYALILIFFAAIRAGRYWGLDKWCASLPICGKYPRLRNWLG